MSEQPEGLRDRLKQGQDPSGELWQSIESFRAILAYPTLARMLGVDTDSVQSLIDDSESLVDNTAYAIQRFAPWGWAPSEQIHAAGYARAVAADRAGANREMVEAMIAATWEDRYKMRRPALQIGTLFPTAHPLWEACQVRRWLLLRAAKHHRKGRYEASVPIVLAQIEGVTKDVTGKLFFTEHTRKRADIVSDMAIATLDESLPVVRAVFSASQEDTLCGDDLSRHGILHGRTLGYGTQITSLKCFALLQAVVEWLQPIAQESYE